MEAFSSRQVVKIRVRTDSEVTIYEACVLSAYLVDTAGKQAELEAERGCYQKQAEAVQESEHTSPLPDKHVH